MKNSNLSGPKLLRQERKQKLNKTKMRILLTIISILFCLSIFSTVHFYLNDKKNNTNMLNLKKQNDSLFLSISQNNKKIDSIEKNNILLFAKNDSLRSKLIVTNKKAEKYKKEHEKDINYINSLSDNDITNLFTDKFK